VYGIQEKRLLHIIILCVVRTERVRPGQSARGPGDLFIAKGGRPADPKKPRNWKKKRTIQRGRWLDKTVFTGAHIIL